ncbi:MAG: ATP synthase F0 subunit B [Lachnospiraceae bacterium]|nr:ATP synthase F0 subunit B [Lachnospiraceae bacterium]
MNLPLNIDWQQIFLHLFNFVILATGLYLLLYKPVKDFMDKRAEYYRSMDEEAKTKLSEAETMKEEYENRLKQADSEISKREAVAVEAMRQNKEKEIQQAKKEAEKIVLEAKKEAEREHDRIVDDAQKEVADMVTIATEKLLLQSTAAEAFEQFLDAAERSVQSE